MKNIKHIVFDLDGTLVDSEEAILKCWEYCIPKFFPDYKIEKERLLGTLGVPTQGGMDALGLPYSREFDDLMCEDYALFAQDSCLHDGVKELLDYLKEKEYKLGIVTSREKLEYDNYFNHFHLEDYFETVILKDDTEKHKPNAEPLLKYCEQANTTPQECVYIGDMDTDMMCAISAGVKAILALWGKNTESKIENCIKVNTPEDIKNLFS